MGCQLCCCHSTAVPPSSSCGVYSHLLWYHRRHFDYHTVLYHINQNNIIFITQMCATFNFDVNRINMQSSAHDSQLRQLTTIVTKMMTTWKQQPTHAEVATHGYDNYDYGVENNNKLGSISQIINNFQYNC